MSVTGGLGGPREWKHGRDQELSYGDDARGKCLFILIKKLMYCSLLASSVFVLFTYLKHK